MGLDQVCLTSFYWFLNSTEIYKLKECAEHINNVQDLVITQKGHYQFQWPESNYRVRGPGTFNYA